MAIKELRGISMLTESIVRRSKHTSLHTHTRRVRRPAKGYLNEFVSHKLLPFAEDFAATWAMCRAKCLAMPRIRYSQKAKIKDTFTHAHTNTHPHRYWDSLNCLCVCLDKNWRQENYHVHGNACWPCNIPSNQRPLLLHTTPGQPWPLLLHLLRQPCHLWALLLLFGTHWKGATAWTHCGIPMCCPKSQLPQFRLFLYDTHLWLNARPVGVAWHKFRPFMQGRNSKLFCGRKQL